MLRVAYILIWEEWKRAQLFVALYLFALFSDATFAKLAKAGNQFPAMDEWGHITLSTIGLLMFASFLLTSSNRKNDVSIAMPTRRYVLPVGTLSLVFWPFAVRLTIIAGLSTLVYTTPLWLYEENLPTVKLVCAFTVAFALLQTLAWSSPLLPKWALALIALLLFRVGGWVASWVEMHAYDRPGRMTLLATAICACAFVASYASVALHRRGTVTTVPELGVLLRGVFRRTDATHPFRSPLIAQAWYEWRAMGRKMTLIICLPGCAMASYIAYQTLVNRRDLNPYEGGEWELLFLLWSMPWTVAAAFVVGFWRIIHYDVGARRGAAFFTDVRPVNDALLAWGQVIAAVAVAGLSFLVVSSWALLSFSLTHFFAEHGRLTSAFGTSPPLAIAIVVACFATALWFTYTRAVFLVGIVLAFGPLNNTLFYATPHLYEKLWRGEPGMQPGWTLLLLVCAGIVCASMFRAYRTGLLSPRAIMTIVCLWATGATLSAMLMMPIEAISPPDKALYSAGLALLLVSPFAATALTVRRLRHQ